MKLIIIFTLLIAPFVNYAQEINFNKNFDFYDSPVSLIGDYAHGIQYYKNHYYVFAGTFTHPILEKLLILKLDTNGEIVNKVTLGNSPAGASVRLYREKLLAKH